MASDGSSYYSEDSDRNLTSDEEHFSEDSWEDEEQIYDLREVFGLKVKPEDRSGIPSLNDEHFKFDGSDGVTRWIRVIFDSSIQTDHRTVMEQVLKNIFDSSNSRKDSLELEYPSKFKIVDKKSGNTERLILNLQLPRGDEILLSETPSESKPVVNSLMSHLYIYKHNEEGIEFNNYHKDQKVDSQFGFKTWHKYNPI
ncbi:hypothetical protein HWI79_2525 [Cryptosporidium felis]|nr:hypothetical protein HWI79_2525 [Cryptosporidium felis]